MENLINKKYAEILEQKAYLNATDYLIIKDSELGCGVDEEILEARKTARDLINKITREIEALEKELAESELKPIQERL